MLDFVGEHATDEDSNGHWSSSSLRHHDEHQSQSVHGVKRLRNTGEAVKLIEAGKEKIESFLSVDRPTGMDRIEQ